MKAPVIDTGESSGSEDEWEYVPRRKWNNSHTHLSSQRNDSSTSTEIVEEAINSFWDKLHVVKNQLAEILENEDFWERYLGLFSKCETIAAYGIGSFSESRASLFQFCLLLILIDRLDLDERVEFHEPQLVSLDVAVLSRLGFIVNPDRCASRRSTKNILCYMPHCDRVLYEQVLYDLIVQGCEFTLLSNLLTSYGTEFETWRKVNLHLYETMLLVWKRDWERFQSVKELRTSGRFKAKIAQASETLPFEAFNDLAIISMKSSSTSVLRDLIEASDSLWSKLD